MSRVGLVSTFRFVAFPDDEEGHAGVERCWSVLSSFLLFHLAKAGVDHVFLYADADDGENRVYVGQFRVHSCQEAAELILVSLPRRVRKRRVLDRGQNGF